MSPDLGMEMPLSGDTPQELIVKLPLIASPESSVACDHTFEDHRQIQPSIPRRSQRPSPTQLPKQHQPLLQLAAVQTQLVPMPRGACSISSPSHGDRAPDADQGRRDRTASALLFGLDREDRLALGQFPRASMRTRPRCHLGPAISSRSANDFYRP